MVGFYKRAILRAALIPLALLLLLFALALYRVHDETSAAGREGQRIDFESVELDVQPITFPSTDGLALAGWLIRGEPGMPAILLCHDFGSDKSSLVNLAITLRGRGFTLLMFDFRGHGASAGGRSTLGLSEKRDVLGALDLLAGLDWLDDRRVGLYGIGMGAHAGVLAAADHPAIRVLVLDSLYPDVSYALERSFYGGWEFGVRRLSFIPRAIFNLVSDQGIDSGRADAIIGRLPGRDLLLLAPEGDVELTAAMKEMYRRIPEQTDADGNLQIVPSTPAGTLSGEQLEGYRRRVADFFLSRLVRK